METLSTILFWVFVTLGALSGIVLLPHIAYLAFRLFAAAAFGFQEIFSSGLRGISEERYFSRRRQEMEERIAKHMASRGFRRAFRGGRENLEMYAATALLKETVGTCCEIHHFTANMLGVAHMRELEGHHICESYRGSVLDTLEFVIDAVREKDVSANLAEAKMAVGTEAMHSVCSDCMLLRFKRSDVPRLCDPAKFMGCDAEDTEERK